MYLYVSILFGAIFFAPYSVLGAINEADERTPLNPAKLAATDNDPQTQKDSDRNLRDEVRKFYYKTLDVRNIIPNWNDSYFDLDRRVRGNLLHNRLSPFGTGGYLVLSSETLLLCEFRLKLAYLLKNYSTMELEDRNNKVTLLNNTLDKYKSELNESDVHLISQKLKKDLMYTQKSNLYQSFSEDHKKLISELQNNMDKLLKRDKCLIQ